MADGRGLAGFLVRRVLAASRAELIHLEPVGIIPPVLLGDVVAVLALFARHGDLRTNVRCLGHCRLPFLWSRQGYLPSVSLHGVQSYWSSSGGRT